MGTVVTKLASRKFGVAGIAALFLLWNLAELPPHCQVPAIYAVAFIVGIYVVGEAVVDVASRKAGGRT